MGHIENHRKFARWSLLLVFLGVAMQWCASANADNLPTFPIPRLETGTHTDRPTDIGFDPVRQQLISVSDDRSIRFWDYQSGRLEDTVYVPMSARKDGELYALSVAPQARMLLVAGWTGYTWDKSISIYVFDLDTLEMLGRVSQLPERVVALEFSPDETRLAVTLLTGQLMMFSAPGFKLIAENHDCKDVSYRMHFSANNQLATNCFDGKVRIYDKELELQVESEPWPGHSVSSVHFSPSGKELVISYYDKQGLLILDSTTLKVAQELPVPSEYPEVLPQVIWSDDGKYIFAGGDLVVENQTSILRWEVANSSNPLIFPASKQRIFRMIALPEGSVGYTTLDHAVARINKSGDRPFFQAPPLVLHGGNDEKLLVSDDGSVIQFAIGGDSNSNLRFSVEDRELSLPSGNSTLHKPVHTYDGLNIENWKFSETPTVNGNPIPLAKRQKSRSLAISHDGTFFVLGLDSQIRLFAKDGSQTWGVFTNAGVYSINISKDGKTIVAGLQDGSIRWHRTDNGKEFYALFPHNNGVDWVAWTPPGFYVSSAEGDQYIGWHINQAKDRPAKFYSAWQFERILYRPDIVEQYFFSQGEWSESDLESEYRRKTMQENAPPELAIEVSKSKSKSNVTLIVEANKNELPISHYSVFINDLPVVPFSDRDVRGKDKTQLLRTHQIDLSEPENIIRVEVYTENSISVKETFVSAQASKKATEGDLYILAVGVNHIEPVPAEQSIDLAYAAQDAKIFSEVLEGYSQYKNKYVKLLNDFTETKPFKKNILESLEFLKNSGPNDTVIVFLASHGISNEAGDYFMVPRDATLSDIEGVLGANQLEAESLVRWDQIVDGIRNASGKRFLIVDTCQAQKIEGNFDFGSLAKRSSAMSFGLLAASKGDEVAQEYPPGEQGLFSYSLVQALEGSGDLNNDKVIDIGEMYQYAVEFVHENRLDKYESQTPQLIAPPVLSATRLRVL